MSEFEFAPMRKEYDYFSSPAAEKPSKSLSMYEALSSPAAGNDHSSFEFAKSAPRDFFGNVIEATSEARPEIDGGESDEVEHDGFRKSGRRAFRRGDTLSTIKGVPVIVQDYERLRNGWRVSVRYDGEERTIEVAA